MTRTNPHRRDEILDAAERRFLGHGYLGTSVADLIGDTGIAKGTFYHHFSSKEEVMAAVVDRHTARLAAGARSIVDGEGRAVERFLRLFLDREARPQGSEDLAGLLDEPGAEPLRLRAAEATVRALADPMADLLVQGAESGEFDIADPHATAAVILVSVTQLIDRDGLGWVRGMDVARLAGFLGTLERLLGVDAGALAPLAGALDGGEQG